MKHEPQPSLFPQDPAAARVESRPGILPPPQPRMESPQTFPQRTPKPRIKVRRDYRADNEQAARLILLDPARYPGIMQEWSERVLTPEKQSQ